MGTYEGLDEVIVASDVPRNSATVADCERSRVAIEEGIGPYVRIIDETSRHWTLHKRGGSGIKHRGTEPCLEEREGVLLDTSRRNAVGIDESQRHRPRMSRSTDAGENLQSVSCTRCLVPGSRPPIGITDLSLDVDSPPRQVLALRTTNSRRRSCRLSLRIVLDLLVSAASDLNAELAVERHVESKGEAHRRGIPDVGQSYARVGAPLGPPHHPRCHGRALELVHPRTADTARRRCTG